ncbi:MAG: transporter, partial [Burkholderiales bacterium]
VLTPPGKFVFDPSIEYSNTSGNRLVFRGVEIVTGVQVGVIEASDVDRNSVIGTLAGRIGITDRLEVEARLPYIYRHDELTTLAQRDETMTRTTELEIANVGDVELAARYQMTEGRNGWPIMVGNLRYKSNTGKGPYDIPRDEFGVATKLPTGSGFWGLEPSLTFLLPSDPAVLFANIGYLYHASDKINKDINGVRIGEVDPGDSINASLGFGFAVNQNFSFSLGYRHSYITPTKTQFNGLWEESDDLQAGSVQMGLSYRFNERNTVNTSFEFGVTEDAPDARIVFRMPFSN